MFPSLKRNQQAFDKVIQDIADYVHRYTIRRSRARQAAHYCLVDSLGCAFEARSYPGCNMLLGPLSPGTVVPLGARVPAPPFELDPVKAAFDTSALIRWLDYNDAFHGETVIHPSDCLGAILAAAVTKILGGSREDIMNAVSNAWIDGQTLALFRRGREAGSRKSWAAADAASRGTWLALMTLRGEMGYS